MKGIKLNQGYIATIDDTDYPRVIAAGPWHLAKRNNRRYAERSKGDPRLLHRFILGLPARYPLVDHKDHNGLDCRRANLRVSDHKQNGANMKARDGTSTYKGVRLYKRTKRWSAQIRVNYKQIHLGYFKKEREAASAYDKAARLYFGEFALCNFPKENTNRG